LKLGVAGLLPGNWRHIDRGATERVRNAGFLGASLFIDRPLEASLDEVRNVKKVFIDSGLEVAQANGWYEALVDPDPVKRLEGIKGLTALVRIGIEVGAPTTYVRPGGLNPKGHWFAHPDNHLPQTFDRLVDSLKQVCKFAESDGMTLAIEGHVLSVLDTPQRIRNLLDAVNSPALKFNTDPVNFIGSLEDAYDTTRMLNELFDMLGVDTVAGHAKDVAIQEKLVLHIDEVLLGTGNLDYGLFLTRFEAFCPDAYMLIEHLPDEKVPLARKALLEQANFIGLNLIF